MPTTKAKGKFILCVFAVIPAAVTITAARVYSPYSAVAIQGVAAVATAVVLLSTPVDAAATTVAVVAVGVAPSTLVGAGAIPADAAVGAALLIAAPADAGAIAGVIHSAAAPAVAIAGVILSAATPAVATAVIPRSAAAARKAAA